MTTYQPSPLFAQIQRDAGYDDGEQAGLADGSPLTFDTVLPSDPLVSALTAFKAQIAGKDPAPAKVLILSGGGSWGAFGAGFLRKRGIRDWDAVTGISTGSLQGLFVAAGDYDRLADEYAIELESDLAVANSKVGIVRKGSQYDIAPLRARLFDYLLNARRGTIPFERMARAGAPALFVGMVEASTGDLKIVSISDMIRDAYATGQPDKDDLNALADCVAGVTLASSSIPVRLTPVRIDGKTYFDGGVRSSVFDAGVAKRLAFAAGQGLVRAPELYVIRNGPTVVFRDKIDLASGGPKVDARPDIGRVGMRGYSTIVNQSELMSVAALRLSYPQGPIRVMTADGFAGPGNPHGCGSRPEAVFHPEFMRCLIVWGERKAIRCDWIKLDDLKGGAARQQPLKQEPCDAHD